MGILRWLSGGNSPQKQKEQQFRGFDSKFGDDPQMSAFLKAQWLTGRGNASGAAGDMENAALDFTEAILIDPTYPYAYIGLGTVHREAGAYKEALEVLTRAHDVASTAQGTESRAALFDVCNSIVAIHIKAGSKSQVAEWAARAIAAADEPERAEMRRAAVATGMPDDDADMLQTLRGLITEYGS